MTTDECIELCAKIDEEMEALNLKKRPLFFSVFKTLFEENPALETISWTQYTPYFNDGDPCEFRANYKYASINGVDYGYPDEIGEELVKKIKAILSSFNEDDYESMFGDGVKVIITKDGVTTEEYDHD